MKKQIISLLSIALLVGCTANKNIERTDRSKAPTPGPAPVPKIGEYQKFTLNNGLKVFLVENHKLPRVSFRLLIDNDPVMENDKVGYVDFTGSLLRKGTENRTKEEIDEEIDYLGASFISFSRGFFASSLTKHTEKLMEISSDVLLNPTFPKEELEKAKTKSLSELKSQKNDPGSISRVVARKLNYGSDHPYGEVKTESTVENISSTDLKKYYETYFRPNISYLVVVGDITLEETKPMIEKYFGDWEASDVPTRDYKMPQPPENTEVAFVDRPGAVQSVVSITYPVDLKPGDEDIMAAKVMNSVLGGGIFSGRLMQNLREDKAYTYGARSALSSDKYVGNFRAFASVRNEVTDSSVTQFLYEMDRMAKEKIAMEDLELVKNQMNGSFARSLESPQTIANFALNIARYDLPEHYYDKYLDRLSKVTIEDVHKAAQKYIRPENATILVVGNKEEVAPKLERFASSGKVDFYDHYGKPAFEMQPIPSGVTVSTVLDDYFEALGGEEKLRNVKSLHQQYSMEIEGAPMALAMDMKMVKDKYFMMEITANGNTFQKQVFDGEKGKTSGMMGESEMTDEELSSMKKQTKIFPELAYLEGDYELNLLGIDKVDDQLAYKMEITSPEGEKSYKYFSTANGLVIKEFSTQETEKGPMSIVLEVQEYTEVDGIKFPKTMVRSMGPQTFKMNNTGVEVNPELKKADFKVE